MPTIQTYDPLTAASEAVGAFTDKKRTNDLENQARDYQKSRDSRRDMEADRSFDDTHARTMSDLQTQEQTRKITAATEEYNEKLRPVMLQQQQLQVKIQQGQIDAQKGAADLAKLQRQGAAIDLEIKKKYGVKEAAAALQQAQAQATTATVTANAAPQMAADQHAQAQAGIASTQASTAESQRRLSSGADDYQAPAGPRASASERGTQAYEDAMGSLSPEGMQFYEMLYSTNNPPTRAQAMLALEAGHKGHRGNPNSERDYKNLKTLILSRESSFVTEGGQRSGDRSDARGTAADERHKHTDAERAFTDVAKGKSYSSLPPKLREMIRHVLVDQGQTVQQALQDLPGAPIDDASKAAIQRALSGN